MTCNKRDLEPAFGRSSLEIVWNEHSPLLGLKRLDVEKA